MHNDKILVSYDLLLDEVLRRVDDGANRRSQEDEHFYFDLICSLVHNKTRLEWAVEAQSKNEDAVGPCDSAPW